MKLRPSNRPITVRTLQLLGYRKQKRKDDQRVYIKKRSTHELHVTPGLHNDWYLDVVVVAGVSRQPHHSGFSVRDLIEWDRRMINLTYEYA